MLPNIFADGVIIVCVVIGVLLIIWPLLKGARSIWTEQQVYKYNFNQAATAVMTAAVTASTNSSSANKNSGSNHSNKLKQTYNPLPFEDVSQL